MMNIYGSISTTEGYGGNQGNVRFFFLNNVAKTIVFQPNSPWEASVIARPISQSPQLNPTDFAALIDAMAVTQKGLRKEERRGDIGPDAPLWECEKEEARRANAAAAAPSVNSMSFFLQLTAVSFKQPNTQLIAAGNTFAVLHRNQTGPSNNRLKKSYLQ